MVKRNGDDENGHDGPYTVADAAREYLVSARENARAPKEIEYNINAFILPHLAEVEVKKLTKRRIEKWHREIAKTPARLRTRLGGEQLYRPLDTEDEEAVRKRRVTANKKLTTLKAALNYAWREGRVADREAWMRVQPFKGVDAPRAEYLETDEAVRLINASEDEFRPLVHAALLTGARYGELGALDVRDYSDNAQTVHVRRSKSGKPRDVHLNDEGVAFFRAQTTGRQKRDPMFPRHDGKRWGKSQQARFMTETCQRAEVTVMGFHQLRHTYASHAIMNGAPLGVVAKNLGHADTRMVEKHYGHLADRYMAETIRATAPRLNVETKTNLEKLRPKEKAVESG
jgi:integrase